MRGLQEPLLKPMNEDFNKRLDEALKARAGKNNNAEKDTSAIRGQDLSQAFRVIVELTLSIAICAFVGYWIDQALSTMPIFLLLGVILGLIVGFVTVYKLSNNMGYSIGYADQHKNRKKDPKDNEVET